MVTWVFPTRSHHLITWLNITKSAECHSLNCFDLGSWRIYWSHHVAQWIKQFAKSCDREEHLSHLLVWLNMLPSQICTDHCINMVTPANSYIHSSSAYTYEMWGRQTSSQALLRHCGLIRARLSNMSRYHIQRKREERLQRDGFSTNQWSSAAELDCQGAILQCCISSEFMTTLNSVYKRQFGDISLEHILLKSSYQG